MLRDCNEINQSSLPIICILTVLDLLLSNSILLRSKIEVADRHLPQFSTQERFRAHRCDKFAIMLSTHGRLELRCSHMLLLLFPTYLLPTLRGLKLLKLLRISLRQRCPKTLDMEMLEKQLSKICDACGRWKEEALLDANLMCIMIVHRLNHFLVGVAISLGRLQRRWRLFATLAGCLVLRQWVVENERRSIQLFLFLYWCRVPLHHPRRWCTMLRGREMLACGRSGTAHLEEICAVRLPTRTSVRLRMHC